MCQKKHNLTNWSNYFCSAETPKQLYHRPLPFHATHQQSFRFHTEGLHRRSSSWSLLRRWLMLRCPSQTPVGGHKHTQTLFLCIIVQSVEVCRICSNTHTHTHTESMLQSATALLFIQNSQWLDSRCVSWWPLEAGRQRHVLHNLLLWSLWSSSPVCPVRVGNHCFLFTSQLTHC